MYCTLQEAYNVPTFARKKRNLAPLRVTASAQPYDPITDTPPTNDTPMVYPRTEGFQNQLPTDSTSTADQRPLDTPVNTYNSQMIDYKYYCDNFNICPTYPPSTNSNQQPIAMNQNANWNKNANGNPMGYSNTTRNSNSNSNGVYNTNPDANNNTIENFESISYDKSCASYGQFAFTPSSSESLLSGGIQLPNTNTNFGTCKDPQSPIYEIPISDLSRQQYNNAMEVSLNSAQGSTVSCIQQPRKQNMNNISGFYDDELEQYYKVNDINLTTSCEDDQAKKIQPDFKYQSPNKVATLSPSPNVNNLQLSSPPSSLSSYTVFPKNNDTSKFQMIIDAILFILAGVLIIFLCDQLFKLGMSVGMRDTIEILTPYLKEIANE